jgi:endonuclease/exonuclease/phosphatase family metal-dependent hydrolase
VLQICAQRRLPRVKAELLKTKKFKRAIIAGDFNEPSHLDGEYSKLKLPVSMEFEKQGFVDTFHYKNPAELGYTWPAGVLYKKGPPQRIDMIYTKGIKTVGSKLYDDTNKWISDHKMVITDVVL